MIKKLLYFALPAALLLLNGCETFYPSRANRAAQTQDQLIAQENQRRTAGRLETLEMEIARLSRELDTLRTQNNTMRGQLENRLTAVERKSEEDKRELIARLTAELDKLVKQVAATPAPAPAGGSAYGYEHIVQPGEVLSTIARAYNVTTKAIIEANSLENPDRLSVGQKLFIPE